MESNLKIEEINLKINHGEMKIINLLSKKRLELFKMYGGNYRNILECRAFEADFAKNIFSVEEIDAINNLLIKKSEFLFSVYADYRKQSEPDKKLLDLLCVLCVRYINIEDDLIQYILNDVYQMCLQLSEDNRNIFVYNYICKYLMAKECKTLCIKMPSLIISDSKKTEDSMASAVHGCYNSRYNVVLIQQEMIKGNKKEYLGVSKLAYVMHVVLHELRHARQAYENTMHYDTKQAYDYARKSILDVRHTNQNYYYDECEIDAEHYSWSRTEEILSGLNLLSEKDKKGINVLKELLEYKDAIRVKKDLNGELCSSHIYNIMSLNSALVKKELLELFPIFYHFYNKNGEMKSLKEMIESERDCIISRNDSLNSIYLDYYRYILSDNDFIRNVSGLRMNDKIFFINRLFNLLIRDLDEIMIIISHEKLTNSIDHNLDGMVIETRLNEFNYTYNYATILYKTLSSDYKELLKDKINFIIEKIALVKKQLVKSTDEIPFIMKRLLSIKVDKDFNK